MRMVWSRMLMMIRIRMAIMEIVVVLRRSRCRDKGEGNSITSQSVSQEVA